MVGLTYFSLSGETSIYLRNEERNQISRDPYSFMCIMFTRDVLIAVKR